MPQFASPAPVRITTARAVVNLASGGVGPGAEAQLRAIAEDAGVALQTTLCPPGDLRTALQAAADDRPDLVIVLGGDGTAALAADLCGPDGPMLAPLAGGTMNMLPRALYGPRPWPEALAAALRDRRVAQISGGQVGGRNFYVAAILGEPALWADAREAVRHRRPRLALLRARRAVLRAFSGRLRYRLEDEAAHKARALTLMCPLTSRAMHADVGLEAAALNPRHAAEGFRLGLATLLGRWRDDPAVATRVCREGSAWAKGRVPVVVDGEPHRLDSPVVFRFRPHAFRALTSTSFTALPTETPA